MNFVLDDAIRGLIGGLMIGAASALLLLANGRIAGISGIAAVLTGGEAREGAFEKLAFLLGLVVSPLFYAMFIARPEITMTENVVLLVVGGLLVGVGTRLGNGCTSGHGICGLSRFSTRSLFSVLTFDGVGMAGANATAFFVGGTA